jgi:predicted DNA-binding transcriptional regulator AlpA
MTPVGKMQPVTMIDYNWQRSPNVGGDASLKESLLGEKFMQKRIANLPARDHVHRMISVKALAAKIGCSKTAIYRLRDAGAMPKPLRIGGLLRWEERVIDAWVADGCPAADAGNGIHDRLR